MYAKDEDADIDTLRTYHKNDEEETEVEKEDIVEGVAEMSRENAPFKILGR